jgi:hypothetical protein
MSLVRVMLGVDRLQPRIINSLLERLLEFSIDDAEETEAPVAAGDELALDMSSMPRLILSQLRWLEKICRPESTFVIDISPSLHFSCFARALPPAHTEPRRVGASAALAAI